MQNIIQKFEHFKNLADSNNNKTLEDYYENYDYENYPVNVFEQVDSFRILEYYNEGEYYNEEVYNDETEKIFPSLDIEVKMTFGFYSSSSVCLPDFYSESFLASIYSTILLSFNFFIIIFICVGYVLIFHNIQRKKVDKSSKEKSAQNEKTMFVRVFLIVATDVVCWLPIIIMSFLRFFGYPIPDIAHSISSIVLLPINSLLNPVLYSKIEVFLFKKLSTVKKRMVRKLTAKKQTAKNQK